MSLIFPNVMAYKEDKHDDVFDIFDLVTTLL